MTYEQQVRLHEEEQKRIRTIIAFLEQFLDDYKPRKEKVVIRRQDPFMRSVLNGFGNGMRYLHKRFTKEELDMYTDPYKYAMIYGWKTDSAEVKKRMRRGGMI